MVQTETPDELLDRVAATANTLVFAPTGLAILAGTALVATLDYRVQLLAAGVLGLTTAMLLAITGRPHAVPPAGPNGSRAENRLVVHAGWVAVPVSVTGTTLRVAGLGA